MYKQVVYSLRKLSNVENEWIQGYTFNMNETQKHTFENKKQLLKFTCTVILFIQELKQVKGY